MPRLVIGAVGRGACGQDRILDYRAGDRFTAEIAAGAAGLDRFVKGLRPRNPFRVGIIRQISIGQGFMRFQMSVSRVRMWAKFVKVRAKEAFSTGPNRLSGWIAEQRPVGKSKRY